MEKKPFTSEKLNEAFGLLDFRLQRSEAEAVHIVICGGTALILAGLVPRTTKDVDVLAMVDEGEAISPDPFPTALEEAIQAVARDLDLPVDWLNNGPSRQLGGLFQLGLPEGLTDRMSTRVIGSKLTVSLIDRTDQIHFKLFAAVDREGYHITDLQALSPNSEELLQAAKWARTHDPSPGFLLMMQELLMKLEYDDVAASLAG